MKVTCGIDIIEIERIKESIENLGAKFLERVYTKKEIEYCEEKKSQKYTKVFYSQKVVSILQRLQKMDLTYLNTTTRYVSLKMT